MSLFAGLHRQVLFGGLRIGLYEPVKRFYMGKRPADQAPLHLKIAAGMTTGALAICIASPTDLVKVHLRRQQSPLGTSKWMGLQSIVHGSHVQPSIRTGRLMNMVSFLCGCRLLALTERLWCIGIQSGCMMHELCHV